ncbi:WD40-repeat-containing domain protein [Mucor lusitanicus]|nr:WD40-repeat-containing domain protein [Mucor lusitanicus]
MPFLCCFNRSSGWRIISENYEEHVKGLRSEQFDINHDGGSENYLTCIAISEDGIIAMGSGNKEGSLYFVRDMSAVKDVESGPRFTPLHKEVLGALIHSIDWSGHHLLVGTNQGVTKLFSVVFEHDQMQDFSLIGQYDNSLSEIATYSPSYIANSHIKSAEFSPNYSSQDMDASVHASSQFLTTTVNQLSVWDALEQKAPVSRIYATEAPLNCASWSPNDAQSLIVFGGYDRKLLIVDTRISTNSHNGVVWSADNAHDRPIRDAKFNPFIPYWIASAGEDSVVNIWDIRASHKAPVAKIDGNSGIVTSVTWSNLRPENLGTTASDGTMRYYTLSPEAFPIWDTHYRITRYDQQDSLPIVRERKQGNIWFTKDQNYKYANAQSWKTDMWDEGEYIEEERSTMLLAGALGLGEWGRPEPGTIYKGEEIVNARGAVVKVIPSKLRPSMYYSITSGGQLTANIVRFDAASNLRNRHRFDPADKDALAAKIEDDIYCRRITDAQQGLEQLKNAPIDDEHTERERAEEVQFLDDCLKPRDPIKCTEWRFDSIPDKSSKRISRRLWNTDDMWEDAIQTFKRDLKYWSYRIPPGYNTKYKFPLEFTAPIIAPHLVEEETVLAPLPPKKEDPAPEYLKVPDHIADSPYIYESDLENNSDAGSVISAASSVHETVSKPYEREPSVDDTASQQPIKDRRNMSHVPPIVTIHVDQDPNSIPASKNPFTPPQSATNPAPTAAAPPTVSTNPFESNAAVYPEQSPVKTPKSTNPFEMTALVDMNDTHQQQRSTNPFEYESLPETPMAAGLQDPHWMDDNHSVQSARSEKSEKKHHSWLPGGTHHLGLTLSRHSANSVSEGGHQDEEEGGNLNRTSSLKKHRKFNPFKRMLLRSGTDKEAYSQQRNNSVSTEESIDESHANTLLRKTSSRRNAIHGPF